jgi:CRP-like cAMP-binding protein
MATKTLIKAKKKGRKVLQTKGASRRPAPRRVSTTDEETLSSRQVAAVPAESSTVFDPLLILTRLVGGKSTQEYQSGESVFAQGDKADAVFYIQSGKAKMTVVSKRGKEAVIAILPAGSFLGESCMAGQPLRMASASAVERSTIIRVEKSAMVQLLHQEPEFAEYLNAAAAVSECEAAQFVPIHPKVAQEVSCFRSLLCSAIKILTNSGR